MDSNRDSKRKHDRNGDEDDDKRKNKKSKRARPRHRSPAENREKDYKRKRRHSKSRSPEVPTKQERQGKEATKDLEAKKELPERRAKNTDMLNTRTGGAYIPPARLRMMQAQITDKSSVAYQRLAWEALKKSIHGHINKINVGNIGIIIKELLKENIVRGRGLLCRSVIQAQAASPTFTNVYAALVSAVNSRFPNIGELLLKRLVIQFKRGFKRNDKPICISSASFIAHLVNQRVAHEILALELLTLLVETPTDDSVEVAIAFLKECGQKLTEVSSKGVNAIFEMLRNILHEGQLDKRVQYMIEVMFQVWKDGFKDHPALIEELELVPEEEQFTHLLMLDDATDPQDILNVFKFDDKYEETEQKYKTLSKEILGSDAESGEEDGSEGSGSEDEEDEDDNEAQKPVTIIDNTETNLVALRRTIYLTINSSLDFEECAHKLMKMQLKPGQEIELCHMFLDCCAEQRTYEKFYGLLAQRFCNINRIYIGPFEEIFKDSYSTAHRLDTNRLRNVSKFFAHLLFTDSISWEVMECVKLNEEDTTSSSRIYIKILFQELAEYMGLKKLNDRLQDPTLQEAFAGIFPRDNPKNTRFSINFFTSIGLGGLTDELREHLKQMPKNVPAPITEINLESGSSSESSSSSSSGSSSSSDSSASDSSDGEGENAKKKDKSKSKKKKSKSPKTPEGDPGNDQGERWGHDGFYDTYGKDAQRVESRPDRQDRDNFVKPWDRRRNESDKSRQASGRGYDHRNGDYRRQDRREERNERDKRQEEDRRSDRNRQDREDKDRNKHYDDDRSSRNRQDNEGRVTDKDRNRCNEERINENRRDSERTEVENRYVRNREEKKTRRENITEDRDRHDEDRNDKRKHDDERSNKRRQDNTERENRSEQNERSEKNERYKRNENERESRSRQNENDRSDKDRSRNKRNSDNERLDRDYKDRNDITKMRRSSDDNKKRSDRNESRKEGDKKDERSSSNRRNRDSSNEEDDSRRGKYQAEESKNNSRNREDKRENRHKSSDQSQDRRVEREERVESSDNEKREDKSRSKKKNKKGKNDRSKTRKETESEDSSSESSSPEKSRKKNKKRRDTDSSDEDKTKKTDKRKNRTDKIDSQEWDIPSRKSAKKEIAGRYWDNQDHKKKGDVKESREKRREH